MSGDAALGWAKAQNEATFAALGDPAASPTYGRILEVLESKEKIPGVSKIGDFYYNFWTDEANPRGLLRRVPSLEAFRSEDPPWETVLDVDALGRAEGESWVYKGSASCREYDEKHRLVGSPTRTLVSLSPGGSDAIVRREFDLAAKAFVGGDAFELLDPSKSRCSWLDRDTLFLGADLKDGDLTSSGYPRTVREWTRGTDPKDAPVVFEGEASDVSVGGYVSRSRGAAFEWRYRATTFYTTKKQVRRHSAARDGVWHRLDALGLPDDAQVSHLGDQLLVEPRSDLVAGGTTYPAGSYLAVGFDDFVARGVRGANFEPLFVPSAKTSLASAAATRDRLVLTVLDNVRTRLVFLEPVEVGGKTTWRDAGSEAAPMIRGVSASPVDAEESNAYFLRTSTYLEPSTLALADAAAGAAGVADAEVIKALPAMFDAAGKEAFQGEATSADGTKIPFFCVRTAGAPPETPCLLYGYGGFEISNTPGYGGTIGAGWLERGATYVVANIRGGGEFGPRWHHAAAYARRPSEHGVDGQRAPLLGAQIVLRRTRHLVGGGRRHTPKPTRRPSTAPTSQKHGFALVRGRGEPERHAERDPPQRGPRRGEPDGVRGPAHGDADGEHAALRRGVDPRVGPRVRGPHARPVGLHVHRQTAAAVDGRGLRHGQHQAEQAHQPEQHLRLRVDGLLQGQRARPRLRRGPQGRTRERNSQLQSLISRPFSTRFG